MSTHNTPFASRGKSQEPPWPCATCGAPGVRNVGVDGHCAEHLAELYTQFDPAVWQLDGHGLPGRSADPRDLTCVACGATWTGVPGERCGWCARLHISLTELHRRQLLTAPDVDPLDVTWAARVNAWVDRLNEAIKVGALRRAEVEPVVARVQRAWEEANHDITA